MRRLVLAVTALAACYRPSAFDGECAIKCDQSNACPDNRTCSGGYCLISAGDHACTSPADSHVGIDADSDAAHTDGPKSDAPHGPPDAQLPPDAPPVKASCTPATTYTAPTMGTSGTDYTSGAGHTADTNGTDSSVEYDGVKIFTSQHLYHPRLAAGGDDLYFEYYLSGAMGLYHSKRTTGSWSVPGALGTSGIAGIPIPGTASETSPRRMILVNPNVAASFQEGVERASDGVWVFATVAIDFGTLASPVEPSLSSDGLRLVFRAVDGTTGGFYVVTRTALDAAFSAPHLLIAFGTSNYHDPFLPSDACDKLYFDNTSSHYSAHE